MYRYICLYTTWICIYVLRFLLYITYVLGYSTIGSNERAKIASRLMADDANEILNIYMFIYAVYIYIYFAPSPARFHFVTERFFWALFWLSRYDEGFAIFFFFFIGNEGLEYVKEGMGEGLIVIFSPFSCVY